MSSFIRKLSKIGIIVTLMMFCVGMASAATYDEFGIDLEKQTGYISVEKLNNHPDRFKALPTDNTIMYLDVDSIKVIRDDSLYRVLEYKVFTVITDNNPVIMLSDMMAKFDMEDGETLVSKTVYLNMYELDGKYLMGEKDTSSFRVAPEWSPAYIMANGAYTLAFKDMFSEGFREQIVEELKAQGLRK